LILKFFLKINLKIAYHAQPPPIFSPFGELTTDKKLADKDLLEKPILVPAQESHAFKSDKLPLIFSISAQGQLSVNLFNDVDDVDDLGWWVPNLRIYCLLIL